MPERSGVVLLPPSRWWVDAPPPSGLGLAIGRWVTNMLARRWNVEVFGRENVPLSGPVILASNHMAMLDGPVMAAAAPRAFHALVKIEMFVGPGTALLLGHRADPGRPAQRRPGRHPVGAGGAVRGSGPGDLPGGPAWAWATWRR